MTDEERQAAAAPAMAFLTSCLSTTPSKADADGAARPGALSAARSAAQQWQRGMDLVSQHAPEEALTDAARDLVRASRGPVHLHDAPLLAAAAASLSFELSRRLGPAGAPTRPEMPPRRRDIGVGRMDSPVASLRVPAAHNLDDFSVGFSPPRVRHASGSPLQKKVRVSGSGAHDGTGPSAGESVT